MEFFYGLVALMTKLLKQFCSLKTLIWTGAACASIFLLFVIAVCKIHTEIQTAKYLYSDHEKIPANDFAVVLGVSKTLNNKDNLYFRYRIKAAAKLYHNKKVKYILVSGARRAKFNYDEPTDMKRALITLGVPARVIFKDNHGFRTLDSVVRAHEVFGLTKFTIVSQNYHNSRAVYIARHHKLEVVAMDAKDCMIPRFKCRNHMREYLAKVKMMLDLYLLNTRPRVSTAESEIINLIHKAQNHESLRSLTSI
jgi:SanA protein